MATMAPTEHEHAMRNGEMAMDQMVSFAQMLRALDPKVARHLKFPHWFPKVYDRKDQCELDENERERFLCAYQTLIGNGTLGQFVKIHGETHYQHGTQRFLPWHRVYLYLMDQALKTVHPDVSIPYWNWENDHEVPTWLSGFTPTVPMPAPLAPITVTRSPGTTADLTTIVSNIPTVMGNGTFAPFTSSLEGVHGAVHVWVGGTMGFIATAPADPIFWMHHANIDRLWWEWQQGHAGENPNLTGTGASSPVMDPWSWTEPQTRDIAAMGYEYV